MTTDKIVPSFRTLDTVERWIGSDQTLRRNLLKYTVTSLYKQGLVCNVDMKGYLVNSAPGRSFAIYINIINSGETPQDLTIKACDVNTECTQLSHFTTILGTSTYTAKQAKQERLKLTWDGVYYNAQLNSGVNIYFFNF